MFDGCFIKETYKKEEPAGQRPHRFFFLHLRSVLVHTA